MTGKTGPWQPMAEELVNEEGGRGEGKKGRKGRVWVLLGY